ncbi:MAG: hypothetical protein IJJ99_00250 [Oscillospiraceae bacterium]|nr:hypothetical protein [Oscillospiraceae bacterium]
MKKRLVMIILAAVLCLTLAACAKTPGTLTISFSTKNGVESSVLGDGTIVSVKEKTTAVKKNTMTDSKTGNTIVYEITDISCELTAMKSGETTLTITYTDYKTEEQKVDVYTIVVDEDLNVTATK